MSITVQVITYADGQPVKAVVMDDEAGVNVMCTLGPDGWEPLYGLLADNDRLLTLPNCFVLSEECITALFLAK